MANKRRVENGIPITILLDEELVARIDEMASKIDMPRSRLMRNFIRMGAEDFETLDAIGLITLVKQLESVKKGLRAVADKYLGRNQK